MSASRRGLVARLLAAHLVVVVAAVLTAWVVAAVAGPPLFHDHLDRAGGHVSDDATRHAEEAYQSANAISLAIALVAALVAALAVSGYVTRRIGRSVSAMSAAAATVAAGRYDVRVPSAGIGVEFDALTGAFNRMADRLHDVEATRRRLLADLAHEMRTPVATLDAYLEGIEDGVATLDPPTAAMLRAQTTRLGRLAADVSAISRAEEGRLELHPRPLAAADVVEAAITAARDRYAREDVRLTADVPATTPSLVGDPERLAQVLGNLLDNALRHTPAGGAVTVAARGRAGRVEIAVTDTGSGIPAEHLPHVFERFYRVDAARDRAHGGSGIGLAIAKALVEAQGGSITATSAGAERGATFVVAMPVAAPAAR